MDWTQQVDGYCERLGPGLLAEPLNLVSNTAFLLAAVLMWYRCPPRTMGRALAVVLFVIGIGSGLFHSVATRWASVADVVPIAGFVLLYIFIANRQFVGLRLPAALGATLAATVAMGLLGLGLGRLIPAAGANAAYAAVAVLILGYGAALMATAPRTGRRLLLGTAILALSITLRALDLPLCGHWPWGTHFIWHLLNAVLLAWMIEIWRLHRLEAAEAGR